MLKILGRANSANVQKVTWACAELGVEFEREDYGGAFGKVGDPEYKELNPNSRVPTLVEDDFVLWESNAIVRYLAERHGQGSLCPSNARDKADADRWMDWQQTTVLGVMFPIFWGLVRTPEAERDLDAIENARTSGIGIWQILEDRLQGREYIVGDDLTMADIPVAIQCYRWLTLIDDRPSMPALEAWYERCSKRDGFQQHILSMPLS